MSQKGLQSRAPLGQKTTNAKALTGQTGGVKNILKPTTQKPKPKTSFKFEVKSDHKESPEDDDPDPEYAPPRPADLPYESDLLPKGGFSMEGLKKDNLFRGFHDQFYNTVDDNGVSRKEKEFNDEMKAFFYKAMEDNERDLDAFSWSVDNITETKRLLTKKPDAPEVAETKMARKVSSATVSRQPATIKSRKAAGALSIPAVTRKPLALRPAPPAATTRRHVGSLMAGQKAIKQAVPTNSTIAANSGRQVASRTTLGYKKGKSVSSMMQSDERSQSSLSSRTKTSMSVTGDDESELTMTPARARHFTTGLAKRSRPEFMSIFDPEGEDDELPEIGGLVLSDEEDEFELKLDI